VTTDRSASEAGSDLLLLAKVAIEDQDQIIH
jgi:hypothetical protein